MDYALAFRMFAAQTRWVEVTLKPLHETTSLLVLQRHIPQVSWKEGQITQWDTFCISNCLKSVSPKILHAAAVQVETPIVPYQPPEYSDLS